MIQGVLCLGCCVTVFGLLYDFVLGLFVGGVCGRYVCYCVVLLLSVGWVVALGCYVCYLLRGCGMIGCLDWLVVWFGLCCLGFWFALAGGCLVWVICYFWYCLVAMDLVWIVVLCYFVLFAFYFDGCGYGLVIFCWLIVLFDLFFMLFDFNSLLFAL